MPVVAAIGAGGAIAGGLIGAAGARSAANTQSDAAVRAAEIQTAGANRSADMQLGMFNTIRDDLAPYRGAGAAAMSPYLQLLGINPSAMGAPGSSATGAAPAGQVQLTPGSAAVDAVAGSGGEQDWDDYLKRYPDVQAEFDRLMQAKKGPADLRDKGIFTPQDMARYHYATMGAKEGRTVGLTPVVAGTAGQAAVAPTYGTLTPEQLAQQQRQTAANIQTALELTPGYQFTKQQGLKAVNNSSIARGFGDVSGALGKGIARFVTGLADSTYNDQLNRYKDAVSMGQNAAVQTGNAGTTAASGAGAALVGGANAGAAGTIGAANAGAAGTIAGANAIGSGINSATNGYLTSRVLSAYAPPTFGASQANAVINSNPNLF